MQASIETAIVVGASSGIGAALARQLASEGAKVALVARREEPLRELATAIDTAWGTGTASVYVGDVQDHAASPALFDRIREELGGCDFCCYAAGVMAKELEEDEFDFEKDAAVLDVNLTAAVAWLNPVARYFQEQKKGILVGIGSIAGDRGRRAYPSYHAAKAGFSTFLESLRNRLTQHGVQVTTIKPGFIDTAMTKGMKGLLWLRSADEAAVMIMKAVRKRKQCAYVPARWRLVSLVIRSIPSFLFRRMSI